MKVFFNFDIMFPKGRISRKNGNADIEFTDDMSIEDRKNDEDLKKFIAYHVNSGYKTGKIFSVSITDIK